MKLSENFTFEELSTTQVAELLETNVKEAEQFIEPLTRVAVELLEPVRELFQKPMKVNSGFRGKTLNERVGGSNKSQHCLGEAADFTIQGYKTDEELLKAAKKIYQELPNLKFGQLLVERGCLHISLGTKKELAYYDVPTKTKNPIAL
jgi:uncharacterized protein YcbK (DUF882 family)